MRPFSTSTASRRKARRGSKGREQPPQYRVINAHSLARIGFWLYFKVVDGRGRCTNDAYRWNCPEPGPCRVEERADRCADGHRYYVVEAGTHVDSLYDEFPGRLRPILPCYLAALTAFERWVEDGESPGPASPSFVPKPAGGDVVDDCSL